MKNLPVLLFGWLLASPALAEQTWYLMSRHGECMPIAVAMRHKMPDFPAVQTPDAFVKAMNDRGIKVELTAFAGAPEGHHLAKVPAFGWELLIVSKDRCSSFSAGPK